MHQQTCYFWQAGSWGIFSKGLFWGWGKAWETTRDNWGTFWWWRDARLVICIFFKHLFCVDIYLQLSRAFAHYSKTSTSRTPFHYNFVFYFFCLDIIDLIDLMLCSYVNIIDCSNLLLNHLLWDWLGGIDDI